MNAHVRPIFLFALIAVALITQFGASCTNTNPDTRSRDGDLDSSVAIPRDARIATEGTGRLSYSPKSDGRVYLYDLDDRTVLDNRPIRRGQLYTVTPDHNRVELDGRAVTEQDLKRKHSHRIYFRSDDRKDRDDRDTLSTDRLPSDAKSVATGSGEISYRARERGRIYVYDADDQRVLFVRDIYDGQTILVDPQQDRILIDGKKVYDNNLERKHAHRIYFEKD